MNKFVTAALATAAFGTPLWAGPGDSEWLELDSEIHDLATSLRPAQDGAGWSALIRANYTFSADDIATGVGGADISGFELDDIDIAFWGTVGDYGWRINFDLGTGASVLEDAYVYWDCGELFRGTMGSYKPSVLRSANVDPENQVMIDRPVLGALFDFWNPGLGVSGAWENIDWAVSYMNGGGTPGDTNNAFFSARAEMSLGEAGASSHEGALGGGEDLNGTVGLSYVHDDSGLMTGTFQDALFLDANGNVGQIGFGFEIGFIGDTIGGMNAGAVGGPAADFSNTVMPLVLSDNSVPWDVTVSYCLNAEYEVAARYQMLDNDTGSGDDNSIVSLGLNWYQSEHNAKWQAGWSFVDGDTLDGNILQLGVVVGASR